MSSGLAAWIKSSRYTRNGFDKELLRKREKDDVFLPLEVLPSVSPLLPHLTKLQIIRKEKKKNIITRHVGVNFPELCQAKKKSILHFPMHFGNRGFFLNFLFRLWPPFLLILILRRWVGKFTVPHLARNKSKWISSVMKRVCFFYFPSLKRLTFWEIE